MFSQEELKRIEEISSMEGEQQARALQAFLKTLSPEKIEYLKGQQRCIFCSITSKQVDSIVVYEDNGSMAVMDINPASIGHVIVLPKKHLQFYWESNNSLDSLVKMLSLAIVNATKAEGMNVMIANGMAAGQLVGHLAVHLIPRYKDDGIVIKWEGRQLAREKLAEVARRIAGNLAVKKSLLQPFRKTLTKIEGSRKEVEKREFGVDESWLEERIP